MARPEGKDALARGLGWFSVGLGAAQVAAPRGVSRLIGVGDHARLMRAMGVRELPQGLGILARPGPVGWLWSRVAGDALDLALLVAALPGAERRKRVVGAIGAVAGVTVPDVVESVRLGRAQGGPQQVTKAITVSKPPHEVYAFWRDLENLPRFMTHLESVQTTDETRSHWKAKAPAGASVEWDAEIVEERPDELIAWRSLPGASVENSGVVRFAPAPGGRGTEVRVELDYSPPGGALGATAAKLFGEEPEVQLQDDLRRFKQVLETGEVARSEGSPRGESFAQHLLQRAAKPRDLVGGGSR
jgi:uncharacterized membrane protein